MDFRWFKLHDVIRDLAFYILENGSGTLAAKQLYLYRAGQNLEEFLQDWEAILNARRLALQLNKLKRLPRRICAAELLSLLLGGNPIVSLPASFSRSFQKLRVLNLSRGEFWYLPEELGHLKDLVWLDLNYCENLEFLPDAVRKLHVLKHLNILGCKSLKYLPSGLVGLTSLQVLQTQGCRDLTWAEYTASGRARAESLCHVCPTVGVLLEDMCELGVLTELHILENIDPRVELPHNMSALTKLKVLELGLENIKTLPAEMLYWFTQLVSNIFLFEPC
jgi:Leucine-rich repeat (LRR) protein